MVQILEHHLEKLLCSQCRRYLSVLPVKIYPNKDIKCGRCIKYDDEGTVSLYNTIAKNCLFKCINRYDGCRKLLPPDKVLLHEQVCVGGSHTCPKCDNGVIMSAFDLRRHFVAKHPRSYVKENCFYLRLSNRVIDTTFLCTQNDNIVFVVLHYLPGNEFLDISVATINYCYHSALLRFALTDNIDNYAKPCTLKTDVQPITSIFFNFNILQLQKNSGSCKLNLRHFRGQEIRCELFFYDNRSAEYAYEVELFAEEPLQETTQTKPLANSKQIQTMPENKVPSIQLTSEFKKRFPDYTPTACGTALCSKQGDRVELVCSNCKHFFGSNVFSCVAEQHSVCWDCKTWCGICECPINGWNSEISSFCECLRFPCRWRCNTMCSSGGLREHEIQCLSNKHANTRANIETLGLKPLYNLRELSVTRGSGMSRGHPMSRGDPISRGHPMIRGHIRSRANRVARGHPVSRSDPRSRSDPVSTGKKYFILNNYLFYLDWQFDDGSCELIVWTTGDMDDCELFVILNNNSSLKVMHGRVLVKLEDNPKFYLKCIR